MLSMGRGLSNGGDVASNVGLIVRGNVISRVLSSPCHKLNDVYLLMPAQEAPKASAANTAIMMMMEPLRLVINSGQP